MIDPHNQHSPIRPRDFDRCAYRSKSGQTTCGALRYYHDRSVKRHEFVEPDRALTDAKRVTVLTEALRTLVQACTPPRLPNEPIYGVRMPERAIVDAARAVLERVEKE